MSEARLSEPGKPAEGASIGYLPTLDGWRAIAVLLVILQHTTWSDLNHPAWYQGFGDMGVGIFFALSGFLICSRLIDEKQKTGRVSLWKFYVRRLFRIGPAAWLYLLTIMLLSSFGLIVVGYSELLSSFFYCRNYVFSLTQSEYYTTHFWSLAVEEHFYVMMPLLIWYFDLKKACWIFPFLAVMVGVWWILDSTHHFSSWILRESIDSFRTDYRLDALLWGCFVASFVQRFRPGPKIARSAGAVAATVFFLWIAKLVSFNEYVVVFFVPTFLFPIMIASTVLAPNGPLGVVLESRLFRWVGRLSYSLYLWQMLFFVMDSNHKSVMLASFQEWPLNWIALFVVASISYYFVELPMVRCGHRFAKPATPGRPS